MGGKGCIACNRPSGYTKSETVSTIEPTIKRADNYSTKNAKIYPTPHPPQTKQSSDIILGLDALSGNKKTTGKPPPRHTSPSPSAALCLKHLTQRQKAGTTAPQRKRGTSTTGTRTSAYVRTWQITLPHSPCQERQRATSRRAREGSSYLIGRSPVYCPRGNDGISHTPLCSENIECVCSALGWKSKRSQHFRTYRVGSTLTCTSSQPSRGFPAYVLVSQESSQPSFSPLFIPTEHLTALRAWCKQRFSGW